MLIVAPHASQWGVPFLGYPGAGKEVTGLPKIRTFGELLIGPREGQGSPGVLFGLLTMQ